MESKIDLSQVTPVNYKVTVVLVNQFAVTTIQFLNRFSSQCEEKLRYVSEGIYRVNAGKFWIDVYCMHFLKNFIE